MGRGKGSCSPSCSAQDSPPPQQQRGTQPQITAARWREPALKEYANTYSVATTGDSDNDSDGNPKEGVTSPQGVGLVGKGLEREMLNAY